MNESFLPVPPPMSGAESLSGERAASSDAGRAQQIVPLVCPMCHEPVRPEFYFCPNCGKNLKEKPLSISAGAQLLLYSMSVITPLMCFLTIRSWKGMKYLTSENPKAKQIGIISIVIMVITSIVLVWAVIVLTQQLTASLTGGLLGGSGSGLNGL